ncbi:MAG: flagellar basal body rod protein FlgB [Nitrospinae bacterium CG11_big_fil_rev_8_21_14_0_20_56_8]|nr:MAG: flagellar basal body rod protein FlgB [Nitrospinae bacterium CG11_big_fil_rev_8_21_14_0_20_56_8]
MLLDRLLFFDRVPSVLTKALNFASKRNLLISSNIANVETPGYKASDVDFRSQLNQVLDLEGEMKLTSTNQSHLGPSRQALEDLEPEVFEEVDAAKSNGNNVDIDKEMGKLAENQIIYNTMVQLMVKRGSTVRAAITELPQQ